MSASRLISKGRLEALSDGIYAVALTLLAVDLKLPALPNASDTALNAALVGMAGRGALWLLSF